MYKWRRLCVLTEATTTGEALSMVVNRGFGRVSMESDSKVLIEGVSGSVRNRAWTIFLIPDELRRMSSFLDEVKWKWIPRNLNRAMHVATLIDCQAMQLQCFQHFCIPGYGFAAPPFTLYE